MGLEELTLRLTGGVVAVVVEPRLADRDRLELAEPLQVSGLGAAGVVWVDPEDREDAGRLAGEANDLVPTRGRRADLEDPVDPGGSRALDQLLWWIGARVQVRVRVDHAGAAWAACSSLASSSWTTFSGSSFLKSCCGSSSFCPGARSLGSQAPTHEA